MSKKKNGMRAYQLVAELCKQIQVGYLMPFLEIRQEPDQA